jgi:superfamily II DNA or RNA helicase
MPAKDLFSDNYKHKWPLQDDFPINNDTHERTVKSVLLKDIAASSDYLIVTGFTSLANLIEIFGTANYQKLSQLRVALGFEPEVISRKKWPTYNLVTEVKNYWLRQGISIVLGGAILNLIERIRCNQFDFRLLDKLHAKIYIGNTHAIMGSANFSKNGITKQQEANIRVSASGDEKEEYQYKEIQLLAENFYDLAEDYNEKLIDLLNKLLKDVTWQEALARAVAEVTEGEWLKEYPELYKAVITTELWPTQRMGLSKAMYVIQNQGNVLIADPTGSGKTKLCTALAYTLFHWLLANGKKHISNALIISPKQILDNWQKEEKSFKIFNNIKSMGILSTGNDKNKKQAQIDIDKASILIIDEAHNYLNRASKRSRSIIPAGSSHIILSTATPINKKAEDLLRLIEFLSDEDLDEYIKLRTSSVKVYNEVYINKLRSYINQFIVRRTKRKLNEFINKEPEKYHNHDGKLCKYPKAISSTYKTGETDADRKIAGQIKDLCGKLKGVNYLQKIKHPEFPLQTDEDKQKYITQRLNSAPALAGHTVKSALRSSRCALMETLTGSQYAMDYYKFESVKSKTGNVIQKIKDCKNKLPVTDFSKELLPTWLNNFDEYKMVCDAEISYYEQILVLTKKLSDARDNTKVKLLYSKVNQYGKLLAFDSTILTLDYFKKKLSEKFTDIEIIVATGQSEKNKELVKEIFGRGSINQKKSIALCSDAMSEGVNLQDARALILLDTPSVLRLIEQRIGRLERMDSEHEKIHVYWSDDSDEFSLNGDKKIIDILAMTDSLIGNNVEIPKALYEKHLSKSASTKNLIKAYEEYSSDEFAWEGIKDSFQSLYDLVEGESAIIPSDVYEQVKDVEATIKTRVSFVESENEWSFFAIRGDNIRSPKWYFIDDVGKASTDFSEISELLRFHLQKSTLKQEKWTTETNEYLIAAVKGLRRKEIELLPYKKKRALDIAKKALHYFFDREKDLERKKLIKAVTDIFDIENSSDYILDFNHFADLWLEILQPLLDKKRKAQLRKRKVISLRDIRPKDISLSIEKLQWLLDSCQYNNNLDEMIVSCIISIKKNV